MVLINILTAEYKIEAKEPNTNKLGIISRLVTFIKKGVTLGANSTIICGTTIGEFAFVGAGSVVNKNVPPYALIVGVVAKQIGWISKYGEKLDLPLRGNAETICKQTNQRYQLKGNQIIVK